MIPAAPLHQQLLPPEESLPPASCQPAGRRLPRRETRPGGFANRPLPRFRRFPRHLHRSQPASRPPSSSSAT